MNESVEAQPGQRIELAINRNSMRTSDAGYIVNLDSKTVPAFIGTKAINLHRLKRKKFKVPNTFICTWKAYLDYNDHGEQVLARLQDELAQVISPGQSYAIRSSANIEDGLDISFAGQFCTQLEVIGLDNMLRAIREIWEDSQKDSIKSYMSNSKYSSVDTGDTEILKMAVIIQEMVKPVISGVSFSKNPITALDEIIVEAVQGLGTALVQDGLTPLRWVNKWGGWVTQPHDSPISLDVIQQVVDGTTRIARTFNKEVDLEWVFDGNELYWLQMRDITSIKNTTVYSNRMAKEMTPGLVKPLVWSVSVPNPSRVWSELLAEITGKNDLDPDQLMRAFHYRAYQNMTAFGKVFESLGLPCESLEMMLGILPPGAGKPPMKPSMRTIRLLPRILNFLWDKWKFSQKLDAEYPDLYQKTHHFDCHPCFEEIPPKEMLDCIDQVQQLNRRLTYHTIISVLLMQIYNAVLRRQLGRMGIDFQQFDLIEGMDELKEYDPGLKLVPLHQQFLQLDQSQKNIFETGDFSTFQETFGNDENQDIYTEVLNFLNQFGHLSDTTSLFSNPPWRETPGLVLQLIANYTDTTVRNETSGQTPSETVAKGSAESRIRYQDLPKKSRMFRTFYQRSRQFRLYRERISSLYSYSLMLFRAYYLAIGDHMTNQEILQSRDDILYLYDDEVRAWIRASEISHEDDRLIGLDYASKVEFRKKEMEQCQDAILPEIIFGDEVPLILASTSDKLTGTPTSKGYCTGPVRVIHGLEDFHKLNAGDILVIPFSDVSWAPLFAKAGAVVAESGGILSHSSIIAREYNIPAVVSVPGALLLEDDMLVTVDGFKGEVLIHAEVQLQAQTAEKISST